MKINGAEINIDFLAELEYFDWSKNVIKGDKFQACSPFRAEHNPSFAVNLENGLWVDSGSIDEKLHKGNFISLLAYLRNEEYEEIEDYLLQKYSTILSDTEDLQLNLNLCMGKGQYKTFSKEFASQYYKKKDVYLTNRGISTEVQNIFEIGYEDKMTAIVIPWHDNRGNIVTFKYRFTERKEFFYIKDGQHIRNHLYGLYFCIKMKAKIVYLCEAEIDALTLWTYGYFAIAVGGSSLSDVQKNLILNSGIEKLVIATDNDQVGHRFRNALKQELAAHMTLYDFKFPSGKKDINELKESELFNSCESIAHPKIFLKI
ncbi:toprim domain-containing protein [Clostridium ljungdahlii]|uniref:DNA primase n=1 Tax=Clostridium ljungdahlii TaxID=1538 RepID=A0A166RL36_9CLOT|nr:toprim domain-containing protein [Clostridium ljungdahlii]OAA90890.1 DNA primase [Clostridium ljungdahlii]